MKRVVSLHVAVCVLLITAAQPASAEEPSARPDTAESDQQPGADTSNLPDLGGVWAQKFVTTAVSKVPIIGEVVSQTVAVQRVKIDQSGDELEVTTEPCDVNIVSDQSSLKTHIPSRFVAAMKATPRKAYLKKRGDDYYLLAPGRTKVLGARLKGDDENLPRKPSDPRVIDQDEDGHPGMTVRVSGIIDGKLYLLQKSWDRLWGKLLDGGRIAGRVKWKSEQVVLDSTSRWLGDPPESKPHPDPKQSYFRMMRVDKDTTCSDIVAQQEKLF